MARKNIGPDLTILPRRELSAAKRPHLAQRSSDGFEVKSSLIDG
jgi:hypothetical protein